MKTKIILFILLFAGYATAQDYKYFDDVSISKGSLSHFAPKEMGSREIRKNAVPGLAASRIKYNEDFFKSFDPFFKKNFGYPYSGDANILKRVNCHFYFNEKLNVYYYRISYPRSRLEEFPLWEEKLYRFCELCKDVDIKPFVEIWDKEKFSGASFMLNMYTVYRYSENPSKMVFDR